MKNVAKVLFLSVVTCALLVFGCSDTLAANKTITIKSAKKVSKLISNYNQDLTIYTTTGKKTVYGLEFDKKVLKKNMKLTFNKNGDAGLLYLLENSYPNSKITGDTTTDKYITEAAIWLYMDETGQGSKVNSILKDDKNSNDSYGLVSNYIKPLVEKAIKANKEGYKTKAATINVNSDDKALSLTKNKKYYESDYISVDLEGASEYTVSSDATILDENGKTKKSFSASESFKVRIPVSEISDNKVSVSVKASGTEKVAKIFVPSDSKYQSVIGLYNKTVSLKESFYLSVAVDTTCKYIDGNYHDKSGDITDEQTYKQECGNVCKVVNENYYGTDGEETSKLIFDKECANSCVIDGEIYYSADGREVDKNTFDKECPIVNATKIATTEDNSNKDSFNLIALAKAATEKAEQEAKSLAEKAAKVKAEKEKAEQEAKAKAEKEKAEKEAKAKAEKEKAEQEAKAKAEKEKAEKEAQAKAEKEKSNVDNDQNVVNPNDTLEVEVPNTSAEVPFSNILFGSLLVLMGLGLLYKRNKAIN